MSDRGPQYPREEIASRGEEIYERQVRTQVEPRLNGKVVAIDVATGEFAVGDFAWEAADKLSARLPDAQVWFVRIGEPVFDRIGAVLNLAAR
jgi:hypothetical protein